MLHVKMNSYQTVSSLTNGIIDCDLGFRHVLLNFDSNDNLKKTFLESLRDEFFEFNDILSKCADAFGKLFCGHRVFIE